MGYCTAKTIIMILAIGSTLACGSGDAGNQQDEAGVPADRNLVANQSFTLPYKLNRPDQTFELDDELEEISALSMSPDEGYLLAVQDEDAEVYVLDKQYGEIVEKIDFGKDGDYEGLEVIGEDVFVLRSDGKLYAFKGILDDNPSVIEFFTPLDESYNLEGLGFDSQQGVLLLACKAKAGDGAAYEGKRAIYSFNPNTGKLSDEPAYLISLKAIQEFLEISPALRQYEKLVEFFQPNQSEFTFNPSAVAVHPITRHIYVTSAVRSLLLVLDYEGNILHLERMDEDLLPQPEGITFESDGTLYLSTEGKGGEGRIYRFRYRG